MLEWAACECLLGCSILQDGACPQGSCPLEAWGLAVHSGHEVWLPPDSPEAILPAVLLLCLAGTGVQVACALIWSQFCSQGIHEAQQGDDDLLAPSGHLLQQLY